VSVEDRFGLKRKGGRMLKKSVVLGMAVLTLVVPIMAQEAATNAVIQAQQQAEADFNKAMWLGVGCLLGWVGLLIGYLVQPSPPATALMGKSPEYVVAYTEAYKEKMKSLQTKYALVGCLGNMALSMVYVALVASASE